MLDQEIKKEIQEAIEKSVNGRINDLIKEVRGYREDHEKHIKDTEPIMEFIKAIGAGRKGIFWVTSSIVAVGGAYLMIKKIFF